MQPGSRHARRTSGYLCAVPALEVEVAGDGEPLVLVYQEEHEHLIEVGTCLTGQADPPVVWRQPDPATEWEPFVPSLSWAWDPSVGIEAELVRREQPHLTPQIVPPAAEPVAVAQDPR